MGRSNKKVGGLIIIGLILLFALYFASSKGLLAFGFQTTSCSSVSGVSCASQVNGAITSLSQVDTASNIDGLSGTYWLINMVLNGQGQYAFGSSAQQIASAVNSSAKVSDNYPISVQAKLNYQHIIIPYTYSGTPLYMFTPAPVDFQFGWFSSGAGFATLYSQSNQTADSNTYVFAVSGTFADKDEQNIFNAYNNFCTSLGGNTFGQTASLESGGSTLIQGYSLSCYRIGKQQIAQIYSAGSPMVAENVSVSYSNQTASHAFYLTTQVPESSYYNIELAQIVGYEVGALNTFIGTTSPSLLIINASQQEYEDKVVNYIPSQTAQNLASIPSSAFQSEGIDIAGVPFNYIYNLNSLQSYISQQNTKIASLINETVQTTNPYYNGKILGYFSEKMANDGEISPSGAPYYYSVNVTNNPVLYPDIQLIVNAQTLGIYIPVAKPSITSYSPDPVEFRSGSGTTLTFVVNNNASVSASAYIIIKAGNGTLIAQSPDFNIPADSQSAEPVIISGYNPNLANLATTWTATVYSAEDTAIYSSMPIDVVVEPNCPSGYTYVNNTNCRSETVSPTACPTGEYMLNETCYQICAYPSYYNTTSKSCSTAPASPAAGNGWLYVAIIAIIAAAFVLVKRPGAKSAGGARQRVKGQQRAAGTGGVRISKDYLIAGGVLILFVYFAYTGFLETFIILLMILGALYLVAKIIHPGAKVKNAN